MVELKVRSRESFHCDRDDRPRVFDGAVAADVCRGRGGRASSMLTPPTSCRQRTGRAKSGMQTDQLGNFDSEARRALLCHAARLARLSKTHQARALVPLKLFRFPRLSSVLGGERREVPASTTADGTGRVHMLLFLPMAACCVQSTVNTCGHC